jgi:hypothetical protein
MSLLPNVLDFVSEQHSSDDWLFLLLDPTSECATDDPLHIDNLRRALGDQALTRVHRPDFAHSPDACPVLVSLAAPGGVASEEWLRESAWRAVEDRLDHRRYVCGWLSSTVPADALGSHLIALGEKFSTPCTGFLPIYQPLRLELFDSAFPTDQNGYWWPVRHWLFPASGGAPFVLEGKPRQSLPPSALAIEMQQEVPLAAALLSLWSHSLKQPQTIWSPTRWTGPGLPEYAAHDAWQQIRQGRELGLQRTGDLLVLAQYRLIIHVLLHQHPRIRPYVLGAAEGRYTLDAAFATLGQRDWQRIASELPDGVI